MHDLISSLNPFSSKHHALEDFSKLNLLSKFTVLFVTTLASLATVFFCTSLVFRLLVGRLKPLDPAKDSPQNDLAKKIEGAALPLLEENKLPFDEETVLHIFSFLDKNSLSKAMQVCRDFRRIGSDDSLWKGKKKLDEEKTLYENYLKREEIVFRIRSKTIQPQVTELRKMSGSTYVYESLLVSLYDGRIRIYDTKSGEETAFSKPVSAIEISKGNLFCGSSSRLEICNLRNCETIKAIDIKPIEALPLSWISQQEGLIFAAYHNKIAVWDPEKDTLKWLKGGHTKLIKDVGYYQGFVLTYGKDLRQIVWSLENESILNCVPALPCKIYEGKLISLRFSDGVLHSLDFKTLTSSVISFFSPRDHFILDRDEGIDNGFKTYVVQSKLIICSILRITVGDLNENKPLYYLNLPNDIPPEENPKFTDFLLSSKRLIAHVKSKNHSQVLIWDFETGKTLFTLPVIGFLNFKVIEDAKVLVCECLDTLVIWDLEKGEYIKETPIPKRMEIFRRMSKIVPMSEGKIFLESAYDRILLDFNKKGNSKSSGCILS